MMKKAICLIPLLLLVAQVCFCQPTNVVAKFITLDARKNNVDVTPYYTSRKSYFVFYITPDQKVFFASVVPGDSSQSYGNIYDLQHTSTQQTATEYATDTFDFKWSYSNSFDNHQGTATIHLLKIQKPAGIAFELTIIPENLDVMNYKGYMEGSLQSVR